jgi:hypothetical protein
MVCCCCCSYCAPALASSAYALAVLKFRPPRTWAQTLLSQSQQQMPAFGAQELSNLVWALAVLGLRPGAAWFRDFEVQVRAALGYSSSRWGRCGWVPVAVSLL